MLFTKFNVKDKELKLRLRAKDCIELEKRLGASPLDELMKCQDGKLPTITFMIMVLHSSLQALENGYTLEKTYELYDEYVEEGNTMVDLIPVLIEVFKVSGFFREDLAE